MIQIKPKHPQPPQTAQQPATAHKTISLQDYKPEAQKPPQRQTKPFVAWNGSDYRKAYRDIYEFHSKYSPPRLDGSRDNDAYWGEVCDDFEAVGARYDVDSFGFKLLMLAFSDLETQVKAMKAEAEATAAATDQEAAAL